MSSNVVSSFSSNNFYLLTILVVLHAIVLHPALEDIHPFAVQRVEDFMEYSVMVLAHHSDLEPMASSALAWGKRRERALPS